MHCRTAALGGHAKSCPEGHVTRVWYNSCRHRCCPQCTYRQIEAWLQAQAAKLLPCEYFHVVFTLPEELRLLWRWNFERMADLLFRSARDVLMTMLANPHHLGAQPGILTTLHT